MTQKKAVLFLENGAQFDGLAFGAVGEELGEVVFNTSMTGYQEVLTDPSYAGQIVIMTTLSLDVHSSEDLWCENAAGFSAIGEPMLHSMTT